MKRISLVLTMALSVSMMMQAAGVLEVNRQHAKRTWEPSADAKEWTKEWSTDFVPYAEATIDVPTGNSALAVAVKKWMAELMNVSLINFASADELVDAVVVRIKTDENDTPDLTTKFTFKKVYETAKLVTFELEGYDYPMGAAHGMPYRVGATFRKSDGKNMSESLVRRSHKLNLMIRGGLKKYFKVKTNAQLKNCLGVSFTIFPAPGATPWVVKGGVIFLYGPYEIACYAAGMPYAVIPVKRLTPYLTKEGAALLK